MEHGYTQTIVEGPFPEVFKKKSEAVASEWCNLMEFHGIPIILRSLSRKSISGQSELMKKLQENVVRGPGATNPFLRNWRNFPQFPAVGF